MGPLLLYPYESLLNVVVAHCSSLMQWCFVFLHYFYVPQPSPSLPASGTLDNAELAVGVTGITLQFSTFVWLVAASFASATSFTVGNKVSTSLGSLSYSSKLSESQPLRFGCAAVELFFFRTTWKAGVSP